jgi:predicted dehydrogenase
MVPGFRLAPGAELAAICSGRRERAETAARSAGIPLAFDDYREMIAIADLDLVAVATPVATHAPITIAALAAGCNVLCEKPTALNAAEAAAMLRAAEAAGVVHMIDHELRFNPTRARVAELIADGYVGRVTYAAIRSVSAMRADPARPWDWWSDRLAGGGALGASGSHQVDLLRWWLGEFVAVSGQLATYVRARPDPNRDGELREVSSDDQFSFIGRLASGATAHVFVSYVAHHGGSNQIEVHGDAGSLVIDHDDRLWGRRLGAGVEELSVADPLEDVPGLPASIWGRSFAHLARELVAAIREVRAPQRGATFADGLRCQQVLDAVRRSHHENRWVAVEA